MGIEALGSKPLTAEPAEEGRCLMTLLTAVPAVFTALVAAGPTGGGSFDVTDVTVLITGVMGEVPGLPD